METSDRRYHELLASMGVRRARNRAQSPARGFIERHDEDAIERLASAGRTTGVPVWRIASQAAARQLQHHQAEVAPRPAAVPRGAKEILLVEPDLNQVAAVEAVLRPMADVEVCTDFRDARTRLLSQPPDLLITNLRLQAYNGLHLVHLASETYTRCIVYSTHNDLGLAREAQAAGAFFELPIRLPQVLQSYVNATLPHHDRRDLAKLEGQKPFRGGRRCTDR